MKNFSKYFEIKISTLIICLTAVFLSSCHQEQPEDPNLPAKSTILIYAVASNSLSPNLLNSDYGDKAEMIKAASSIDLKHNNILMFQTIYGYDLESDKTTSLSSLLKLEQSLEGYEWKEVKDYNDGIAALNPYRISEVISYVTLNYEAEKYGMIFWSHSTGAQPYFPTNVETYSEGLNSDIEISDSSKSVSLPMQYTFGQDVPVGNGNPYYQLNIEDLAEAIPNNLFDYIWFDSCYMSNIESIYQLRNKCKVFVGYPTEVLEFGLPYDIVLPYLVGDFDLLKGADLFYQYYASSFGTIAVIDMSQIEEFAKNCSKYYHKDNDISASGLFKYTRFSTGPFYDLGDYTKAMAETLGEELSNEEWNNILNKLVLYKGSSERDLTNKYIDPETFSGISTHFYSFSENESENERYYKSLDWYKSVFQ